MVLKLGDVLIHLEKDMLRGLTKKDLVESMDGIPERTRRQMFMEMLRVFSLSLSPLLISH